MIGFYILFGGITLIACLITAMDMIAQHRKRKAHKS